MYSIYEAMRMYRAMQKDLAHGEKMTPKEYGMAIHGKRKKKKKRSK